MPKGNVNIWKEVRSYFIIALGMSLYSFAWVNIIAPAKIVGGGTSGIGMLIYYATGGPDGGGIPIGISYFVINAILLAIGIWQIGFKFGSKTIFSMCVVSVMMLLMQQYLRPNLLGLMNDTLLSAILGGIACGIGVATAVMQGGSSGGTDIIAMVVNKYRSVSFGKVLIVCDLIIVTSSVFVFKDITVIVYSLITLVVTGYTVDVMLQGTKQSNQLIIVSRKNEEIADAIIMQTGRGVTMLEATGWYTKNRQRVILLFCRRNEIGMMHSIIRHIDPNAFITNASVAGVYGNGFDVLKYKKNRSITPERKTVASLTEKIGTNIKIGALRHKKE